MSDLRLSLNTLQGTNGYAGDYSSGSTLEALGGGVGIGIYQGDDTNLSVEIITLKGDTLLYALVPTGTFMQVPLFIAIGSNTTSTDLVLSVLTGQPYV